jgi:hypothetical protein
LATLVPDLETESSAGFGLHHVPVLDNPPQRV